MALVERFRAKLDHHLVLQVMLDRVKRFGLYIIPYHLILENCDETLPEHEEAGGYEACFLNREDMPALDRIDGRQESKEKLVKRLDSGQLCYALKKGDEIVAFSWVDLRRCEPELESFALEPSEAYLCDMHTVKAFRGKGIALHLRRSLYKALQKQGRVRFYSISEICNHPSLRFKQKLGARILRTCLYVRLWNLLERHWVLKDHGAKGSSRAVFLKAG